MAAPSRSKHTGLSTPAPNHNGSTVAMVEEMDKNVTKRHLVQAVVDRTGIGRHEVQQVIEALMCQVVDEVGRGRRIEIRDFGIFEVRSRMGRTAQNPKTLEPVPVPPKCSVRFKPGKSMRVALDDLGKRVCAKTPEGHHAGHADGHGMPLVEVVGGASAPRAGR